MSPERRPSLRPDYIELIPFLPGIQPETGMKDLISPELNQRLKEAGLEPAQRAQVTSALNHVKAAGIETVGELRDRIGGLGMESSIDRLVDLERAKVRLGENRARALIRLLTFPE